MHQRCAWEHYITAEPPPRSPGAGGGRLYDAGGEYLRRPSPPASGWIRFAPIGGGVASKPRPLWLTTPSPGGVSQTRLLSS